MYYIIFLRQWPTVDFGTFIDYFQHYFTVFDFESSLNYVQGRSSLQNAYVSVDVPAGVTRNMFRPMSLTLFGKDDYVADIDQWILSKFWYAIGTVV